MAVIFLNLFLENGEAGLVFRSESGKCIISDSYSPYFYALCDNPEEKAYLFSQHPDVLDTKTESGAVKIITGMKDFRKVIADIRKVPGVKELAETSVPHHFRYVNDRKLQFFSDYELVGGKPIKTPNQEHKTTKPTLRLATVSEERASGGFVFCGEDGAAVGLDEADVVFSWGGDDFLRGARDVVTTPAGCFFREAIHIDVRKDIAHDIYDEPGPEDLLELGKERLLRIIELSILSGAKPDLVSRVTPGKLNVYLHMAAAKEMGRLIPDIKKSAERPKSLRLLRMLDKGGTIFYPKPGIYHNVAKCDFASMYPNIIVRYNISPETMHCTCGDDIEVPEAGWTICRRRGLIPLGLEPVLRRRLELKRLMKAETDPAKRHEYDLRQRALKNILVTCFGYLGFKNFIFSNVECKECVFLLGRHILERTKGIAEEEGLEVLYGIVDSIFVKDGSRCDYERFVGRASGEFGFALELDCIFSSIAFPSSSDGSGVANKYYGITATNKIEARGISLRHSDSPQFIKEFQEKAIRAILGDGEAGLAAGGHDGSAGMACGESGGRGTEAGGSESGARERERNLTKKLCAIVEEYENKLLERGFALEQLAITRSVTKTEYKANQPHVLAYRQAPDGKGHVTFVFTVYGPKPVHMARIEEIDCAQYVRLLRMSVDELLLGISDRA